MTTSGFADFNIWPEPPNSKKEEGNAPSFFLLCASSSSLDPLKSNHCYSQQLSKVGRPGLKEGTFYVEVPFKLQTTFYELLKPSPSGLRGHRGFFFFFKALAQILCLFENLFIGIFL